MYESGRSHQTRSKAAPNWTLEESLFLVNEIHAVESEWAGSLPSFQKWQQIVQNCYNLGVNRNLNQCKRQWDFLLNEYKLVVNNGKSVVNKSSFPVELFNAVDGCVSSSSVKKKMDTDFVHHLGFKKQRIKMKRKNRSRVERAKPWGYFTSLNEKYEGKKLKDESFIEENKLECEQEMVTILCRNAMKISEILEENGEDDESEQLDVIRRKGDEIIECIGRISTTLNQLCDTLRESG